MTTRVELTGRIIWGHPLRAQIKKDQRTRQPIVKDGKPVEQWVFGIAIPKAEFGAKVWPAMAAEIATGYPAGIPQGFSYKFKDGDTNDRNGKPYNLREGYAGHMVVTVSTETFAPNVFKWDGRAYVQMTADQINTGDYFVATVDLKVNVPQDRTHTPGLYVNPVGLLHIGYGQVIANMGADPTELFGAAPPQRALPPGASATPLAPQPGHAMPGMGGPAPHAAPGGYPPQPGYAPQPMQPAPGYPPQGGAPIPGQPQPGYAPQPQPGYAPQPQPGYAPQPQPGTPYVPAHDFVQNAGQQQPGYAPQPAPGGYGQPQPALGGYGQPQPAPGGYGQPPSMPGYPPR